MNKKIADGRIIEEDFNKIFEKVKNILLDPLSVRRYGPLKLKQLQVRVLYGDEIFYKKNEGFQTLTSANGDVLFRSIFESFSSSGAPTTDYFKLINDITTRYHRKEDLINVYITLLKSELQFSYIFNS